MKDGRSRPAVAWIPTFAAIGVVSLVSLVGALALTLPGLRSHRFLLVLVAVAAGTLVGDAFFHLLPEASHEWEDAGLANMGLVVVLGFVAFFLLEVVVRSRHSHLERATPEAHAHDGHHDDAPVAPYAWTNLLGDGIHNFLDGAVIATAFLVDVPLGIATTIAVVIHEVPQELGDFAVLLRAGMKPWRALLFNLGSALLAGLGALLILLLDVDAAVLGAYGLPFIAGAFVYIAAADLIPELHHHSRGRDAGLLFVSFLLGVALMYGILAVEEAGWLGGEAAHEH
jgi:zinc and cadmium transporter